MQKSYILHLLEASKSYLKQTFFHTQMASLIMVDVSKPYMHQKKFSCSSILTEANQFTGIL